MPNIRPISSEMDLRILERMLVENPVQKLVNEAYKHVRLRTSLDLRGTVTFASTTRAQAPVGPKPYRRVHGTHGQADEFCIYTTPDGSIPALAIEYKAPHKLTVEEVVTGLASEIQPARDVINKEGKDSPSRSLLAAVITRLFSYMIGKGIRYGYVCTGETFVFLHIPDDPTVVYFSVCVPDRDVTDDDENRLHRTAVAQVFAFTLRALRAERPIQDWHDATANLEIWPVEYDDLLGNISETGRKGKEPGSKGKEPRASPYKPQRRQGIERSPIWTRSRCRPPDGKPDGRGDGDDDDAEPPPSPTPERSARSQGKGNIPTTATSSAGDQAQGSRGDGRQDQTTKQRIQDRPFCTQRCLAGVASCGPMDESCPNIEDHGPSHIGQPEFLRLIRAQLATDRGRDADCVPLYRSGAVGSLFKVRLSSHGYTLVAKGVQSLDLFRLRHENDMYDWVRAIQGKHVPVCLGTVELVLPYYYDGGVLEHFMFLGWAGRPLYECLHQIDKRALVDAVTAAFTELHKLGVLHNDAEPRNILYDADSERVMIVDLELAQLYGRQPLGPTDSNGQTRKTKRKMV